MKHDQFKEWLQLSLYDELSEKEKKALNTHLKTCSECRSGLDELKKLHGVLAHRKKVAAQKSMLQDSRRALHLRIHEIATHESFWSKLKGAVDDILAPPLQIALSGVAIIAIGILVGYFILKPPTDKPSWLHQVSSSQSVMEAGESQITNIRFLDRDIQTGNIEFSFETITPMHVRGNVNDENIQKVLARALVSNQNTGIRLRAANMIGSQTEQKHNGTPELDAEVKSALISALLYDRNLGVRKEALDVLKRYLPDPTIVRAILSVLANEKNAGLKIEAINSLDLNEYQNQPVNLEIMEMFKQKAQSDDNNYIRIKAKAALQEVRQ